MRDSSPAEKKNNFYLFCEEKGALLHVADKRKAPRLQLPLLRFDQQDASDCGPDWDDLGRRILSEEGQLQPRLNFARFLRKMTREAIAEPDSPLFCLLPRKSIAWKSATPGAGSWAASKTARQAKAKSKASPAKQSPVLPAPRRLLATADRSLREAILRGLAARPGAVGAGHGRSRSCAVLRLQPRGQQQRTEDPAQVVRRALTRHTLRRSGSDEDRQSGGACAKWNRARLLVTRTEAALRVFLAECLRRLRPQQPVLRRTGILMAVALLVYRRHRKHRLRLLKIKLHSHVAPDLRSLAPGDRNARRSFSQQKSPHEGQNEANPIQNTSKKSLTLKNQNNQNNLKLKSIINSMAKLNKLVNRSLMSPVLKQHHPNQQPSKEMTLAVDNGSEATGWRKIRTLRRSSSGFRLATSKSRQPESQTPAFDSRDTPSSPANTRRLPVVIHPVFQPKFPSEQPKADSPKVAQAPAGYAFPEDVIGTNPNPCVTQARDSAARSQNLQVLPGLKQQRLVGRKDSSNPVDRLRSYIGSSYPKSQHSFSNLITQLAAQGQPIAASTSVSQLAEIDAAESAGERLTTDLEEKVSSRENCQLRKLLPRDTGPRPALQHRSKAGLLLEKKHSSDKLNPYLSRCFAPRANDGRRL